jgi:hypothetical protein
MDNVSIWMREYHRYLGFFLAGIMGIYAISGMVLIFRDTDFLKSEKIEEKVIAAGLSGDNIGKELKIKEFKIDKSEGSVIYFKQGHYDGSTGNATLKQMKLPFVLDKMTKLHKANSKSPLFFLNIFFGISLLFFVVSSFYMFTPSSAIMKKGLLFTLAGMVLVLIMLFV